MDSILLYARGMLITCAVLAFLVVLVGVMLSGAETVRHPIIIMLRRVAAILLLCGSILLAGVGFLTLFC